MALTFFAYLGFSVITFAVGDLLRSRPRAPKALYFALGITTRFTSCSRTELRHADRRRGVGYGETAIAEAARPALGDAVNIMAIAALLATSSSVNATLYASAG